MYIAEQYACNRIALLVWYAITQLEIVISRLHLVTYTLMWTTFAIKAKKQFNMKFVCKFFFDFPIPAGQANLFCQFTNSLGLLESVNLRKTCSKLHVRLLLLSNLPTYFDDVATIENNRQVRVNIDAC